MLGIVATFVLGTAWITELTTLNGTTQAHPAELGPGPRPGDLSHGVQRRDGGRQPGLGLRGPGRSARDAALLVAGAGLAVVAALAYRAALPSGEGDLTPSHALARAGAGRAGRA